MPTSLRRKLLSSLAAPTGLLLAIAGAVAYGTAKGMDTDAYDHNLLNLAHAIATHVHPEAAGLSLSLPSEVGASETPSAGRWPVSTSMARKIRSYPVQRHKVPETYSRTTARVGCGCRSSNATQALSMAQALLLALLAWQNAATPAHLIMLAFGLCCINALDVPARQSIVVQLVNHRDDLPNAIALNSFMMHATRFVGPALAGWVVATTGEALCFLLNAASYLAVLLALLAIRLPAGTGTRPSAPPLQALKEGLAYCAANRAIRSSLLLIASLSLLATPYTVLMPLFAKEIFGGDARLFGLLMGCAGAGALSEPSFL